MRANKKTPNGIEIIAREPAMGPHPNPKFKGKLVPYSGVSKLLLADGSEAHECDTCGDVFPEVKQVTAHSTHHSVTTKRNTEVETVKIVLRVVARQRAKAQAEGRRSYIDEAAAELNERGIKTYRGHAWTRGSVYNIWKTYHTIYRIRTPRIASAPESTAPVTMAADAAVLVAPAKKVKAPTSVSESIDRHIFNVIMKDIKILRNTAERLETSILSLEDRLQARTEVPLDQDALNALELLRRAWQQS